MTAIPVTVGVTFLALIFTGELHNMGAWALGTGLNGAVGYDRRRPYRGNVGDGRENKGFESSRSKRSSQRDTDLVSDL